MGSYYNFMLTETKEVIDKQINDNRVVLFMKGSPVAPQCGFSMKVSQVLNFLMGENNYSSMNVLADGNLREGIKEYSDWPTIPQVYIDKEFIGGCDIVVEMFESGELKELLQTKGLLKDG